LSRDRRALFYDRKRLPTTSIGEFIRHYRRIVDRPHNSTAAKHLFVESFPVADIKSQSTTRTDKPIKADEPWRAQDWIDHTQILLDSYRRWTGGDLMSRAGSPLDQSQAMFEAPFVVVSHGIQPDPILNYGNRTALTLWEMDLDTLLETPSRLTAEPVHRDERARLLERTARDGFVDDYQGIRISRTGRRFRIDRATVWNLVDAEGHRIGQAATFSEWQFLKD
jgi:MEKHLA domain